MRNLENNLFTVLLAGFIALSAVSIFPAQHVEKHSSEKNTEQPIQQQIMQAQIEIPQVIIIGKRLPKEHNLLARR